MDISQLYYFIVTAEQEHMTKASETLALSQSALSRSITSLEKELGVSLFDRKNRQIFLNNQGKAFLKDAKEIVNKVEVSKEQLLNLTNATNRNVTISYVHSLGLNYIPSLLNAFQKTNTNHTLSLHEDNAELIIKNLLTDEIDLGFATHYKPLADLMYYPIFKEKIILITSKSHRFAEMEAVPLEEIMEESFIHYNKNTELRNVIDSNLFQYDIYPNVIYEGLEINSVIGLVSANMGIAFVPESTVRNLQNIHVSSIPSFDLERTIYLIHKKKDYISNAAQSFKNFTFDFTFH
ncbi:LysR family transcriptional regulator [Halobacillus sp. B23F22_1]|uniref:LysR family transcriptional regulator n=1 Tax=Halobacillus sp. B23F22_1 TaxID=3459514 RepID=UPI00373F701F